jgi:hypothetical protein
MAPTIAPTIASRVKTGCRFSRTTKTTSWRCFQRLQSCGPQKITKKIEHQVTLEVWWWFLFKIFCHQYVCLCWLWFELQDEPLRRLRNLPCFFCPVWARLGSTENWLSASTRPVCMYTDIYIYMRYLYHIETLSHTGCLKYNINEIPNSRTIVFGDILEIYHWFNRIYIYIYHDISNCCILLPIISFDILVNYTINGRHWCTNKKYRKMTPWINWFMDFSILASSILYHPSIATDRWNQQETPCPIRALLCFSAAANLIALARKGDLATEDDTVNTSGLCFMFLFPLCWWFTHFIYVYIILSQIAWSNPVHFRN